MEQLSRAFICRKSLSYWSQPVVSKNCNKIVWKYLSQYHHYIPLNAKRVWIFSGAGEGTPPDTRFIEDGVCELLKTRRVLKCSYPYGFFLQQGSTQKEIFELMQVNWYIQYLSHVHPPARARLTTPLVIPKACCYVQLNTEDPCRNIWTTRGPFSSTFPTLQQD